MIKATIKKQSAVATLGNPQAMEPQTRIKLRVRQKLRAIASLKKFGRFAIKQYQS